MKKRSRKSRKREIELKPRVVIIRDGPGMGYEGITVETVQYGPNIFIRMGELRHDYRANGTENGLPRYDYTGTTEDVLDLTDIKIAEKK